MTFHPVVPTIGDLVPPLPVADGGTGHVSLTAFAVLAGGTTSTGAVQSLASTGTGGQLITSTGAAALPVMASPWWLANEPAGTLARTLDSKTIATSALAAFTTGGQVCVSSVGLPKGMIVSNLSVLVGTTPANGPTHMWAALLDSTLHVLAVSTDRGNATQLASTVITMAVTTDGVTPYTVASQGIYYVAFSSSASTTAPTAAGITLAGSATGVSPVISGTAGTQAAPPAVAAQLASGTVTFSTATNIAAWIS